MADLRNSVVDAIEGEGRLASIGITVSRSPRCHSTRVRPRFRAGCASGRPRSPHVALTVKDFVEVGTIIADALNPYGFADRHAGLAERAAAIADRYPLYARPNAPVPSHGVVLDFPRNPLPPVRAAAS